MTGVRCEGVNLGLRPGRLSSRILQTRASPTDAEPALAPELAREVVVAEGFRAACESWVRDVSRLRPQPQRGRSEPGAPALVSQDARAAVVKEDSQEQSGNANSLPALATFRR